MVEGQITKEPQKDRIICITGPTATGKTARAVSLARKIGGEIISADSRQVYKGMDLGTGKDLEEYGDVPYHLIDICEAGEKYNLYRFIRDFHNSVKEIRSHNNYVIVCGGTGMYLENALSGLLLPEVPENKELRERLSGSSLEELTSLLKEYKTLHNTTDIDTPKRAIRAIEIEEYYRRNPEKAENTVKKKTRPLDHLIIGIDIPRDIRRERISQRLRKRLDAGMVEEVRTLIKNGVKAEDLIYYGLEYKYLTLYVIGEISYEEMVSRLEIAIHQFAKRQMTWFRGMQNRGFNIHWLPFDLDDNEFNERVLSLICSEK